MQNGPLNTEPAPSNRRPRRSFIRGGGWQSLLILMLFVLFSPIGQRLYVLLLVALPVVAIYWLIRGSFAGNRRLGFLTVGLIIASASATAAIQFRAYQSRQAFIQSLSSFDTITVQADYPFPTAPIRQVSLNNQVSDVDLDTLTQMPELRQVSKVYIEECRVTDAGLSFLDRWPELDYVFIDCSMITDEEIISFREQHPDCSVIPFRRELW